jgi:hypothetical protein
MPKFIGILNLNKKYQNLLEVKDDQVLYWYKNLWVFEIILDVS